MVESFVGRHRWKIIASCSPAIVGVGALLSRVSFNGGSEEQEEPEKRREKRQIVQMKEPLDEELVSEDTEEVTEDPVEETTEEVVEVEEEQELEEEVEEGPVSYVPFDEVVQKWQANKNLALGCVHVKYRTFSHPNMTVFDLTAAIKTVKTGFKLEGLVKGDGEGERVTLAETTIKGYEMRNVNKWDFLGFSKENLKGDAKMDDFSLKGKKISEYVKRWKRGKITAANRGVIHERAWIWFEHDPKLGTQIPEGAVTESVMDEVKNWKHLNPFRSEENKFKINWKNWYTDMFGNRTGIWKDDIPVKDCEPMFANPR